MQIQHRSIDQQQDKSPFPNLPPAPFQSSRHDNYYHTMALQLNIPTRSPPPQFPRAQIPRFITVHRNPRYSSYTSSITRAQYFHSLIQTFCDGHKNCARRMPRYCASRGPRVIDAFFTRPPLPGLLLQLYSSISRVSSVQRGGPT